MNDKTVLAITALLCITVLEIWAIYNGLDGTLLAGVVAVLAGIAGYKVKSVRR